MKRYGYNHQDQLGHGGSMVLLQNLHEVALHSGRELFQAKGAVNGAGHQAHETVGNRGG